MNLVCLTGRITKDLVIEKVGSSGISKAAFNIAVERDFKNSEGKKDADFPRIIVWKQAADYLAKYAGKGTLIEVTGKIQTGSYKDKNGQAVFTMDVVANHVQILAGSKSGDAAAAEAPQPAADETEEYPDIDISDKELPY